MGVTSSRPNNKIFRKYIAKPKKQKNKDSLLNLLKCCGDEISKIDINLKCKHGNSVLMIACMNFHEEIVSMLLKYKPDLNVQNKSGYTAVIYACIFYSEILELLLKHNPNLDLQDDSGLTALMYACHFDNIKAVPLLLKYNVCINLKNKYGGTALDFVESKYHEEVAELMKNYKPIPFSLRTIIINLINSKSKDDEELRSQIKYANECINIDNLMKGISIEEERGKALSYIAYLENQKKKSKQKKNR